MKIFGVLMGLLFFGTSAYSYNGIYKVLDYGDHIWDEAFVKLLDDAQDKYIGYMNCHDQTGDIQITVDLDPKGIAFVKSNKESKKQYITEIYLDRIMSEKDMETVLAESNIPAQTNKVAGIIDFRISCSGPCVDGRFIQYKDGQRKITAFAGKNGQRYENVDHSKPLTCGGTR